MNKGKAYLSAEDLAVLMGTGSLNAAYKQHRSIREALKTCRNISECQNNCICPEKKNLTILEYCRFVDDDYEHIYWLLRQELPELPPEG